MGLLTGPLLASPRPALEPVAESSGSLSTRICTRQEALEREDLSQECVPGAAFLYARQGLLRATCLIDLSSVSLSSIGAGSVRGCE